jgi:hypothetical protein
MFINTNASRAAARLSSAACTARAAGRRLVPGRHRLVHGGQMTGGKGGKVGNPFPGPYSGTQELPVAAARTRAISCRIASDRAGPVIGGRGPRCLTGVGVAPILPHRKNGLKLRKHKAF